MSLNKKGLMSLANLFLVVAVALLLYYALYALNTKEVNRQVEFSNSQFLEDIYVREFRVNSLIQDAFEIAALNGSEGFVSEFIKIIDSLRARDIDLDQIANQKDKIRFENGKAIAEFNIFLTNEASDRGVDIFSANYNYTKVFEIGLVGR